MDDVAINYLGDKSILTNPLYLRWSQLTLAATKTAVVGLKEDLGKVEGNMNNLKIIAYLSTLIRVTELI